MRIEGIVGLGGDGVRRFVSWRCECGVGPRESCRSSRVFTEGGASLRLALWKS